MYEAEHAVDEGELNLRAKIYSIFCNNLKEKEHICIYTKTKSLKLTNTVN